MLLDVDRYHRQTLLPQIREVGQQRLRQSTVLLIGCGALGTVSANLLARAGVGRLILVDRDVVEWTNLQRQVLYTEAHAKAGASKAHAAADVLSAVNSEIELISLAEDATHLNLEAIASGAGYDHPLCDLILDGTDNFATRFLLNDVAVKLGLPLVYGGAIGTHGLAMTVLPHTPSGETPWERLEMGGPCLRCIFGDAPVGGGETCDTVGVLGPAVSVVASVQASQAMQVLTGDFGRARSLLRVELWPLDFYEMAIEGAWLGEACPCCGQREFEYLAGKSAAAATALCGRNAVQLAAVKDGTVDLQAIADRLSSHAEITGGDRMLRATIHDRGADLELTLFPDGRAIVRGTEDPAAARGLYTRFVGN